MLLSSKRQKSNTNDAALHNSNCIKIDGTAARAAAVTLFVFSYFSLTLDLSYS